MRFVTALAFSVAAFAVPFAALADTVSLDIVKAERLQSSNQPAEAAALLTKYLAAHPGDARALVDRGDAYQTLGKQELAIADYSAAIGVNGEYAYAYASRCDSYYELNRYKNAMSDCNTAISLKSDDAYPYRVRSLINIELNDLDKALTDATSAIRYGADSAYSYALRCRVYYGLGKYDLAQGDCTKALSIDEDSENALFYDGRLALHVKQWTKADRQFSHVLTLDQESVNSHYWRAEARYYEERFADALVDINAYVKANADDGDAYMLRALINVKLKDVASARDDATSALRHYRIVNDTDGAQRASELLKSLSGG